MPPNWLVGDRDLRPPGGGKAAPFAAGDLVVESDLAPLYNVPMVAGKVLFALRVSAADAEALNAGSRISVPERSETVSGIEVAAADCRNSCVLILQVSPSESQLLGTTHPNCSIRCKAQSPADFARFPPRSA